MTETAIDDPSRHAFACPHCASTDITWDAITRWDVATQSNVIVTLLDSGSCEDCICEIKQANEVLVDETGTPLPAGDTTP